MNVLVVDVGGTHVKILATGQEPPRKFVSGPTLTAKQMVDRVKQLAGDWKYEVVAIGYPGAVLHGKPVAEPHNLAPGWVGFDYQSAFGCPVKLVNDAAMQALGGYRGGKMLYLGLGTGLGSTMIVDGIVEPMELAHLPYKKSTYEDYVGVRGLKKHGIHKWRRHVADVVERLVAALGPEDVVLGGGNAKKLKVLPPSCRSGDNANAFAGGFRLWEQDAARKSHTRRKRSKKKSAKRAQSSGRRLVSRWTISVECALGAPSRGRPMTLGFNQPLYILPFDHRGSFETKMFGWTGDLTPAQTAEIATAKQVIYDGFQAAIAAGVPKQTAGILVDEQFGAAILRDATSKGFHTACPAEKSGQDEFDFEYGDDFATHIEAFHPTFCKVLVRYNPEGDRTLNEQQSARLRRLSDYLHANSRSLFMFELLVPPEKAQLDRLKGDKRAYDVELRPRLMVDAIRALQAAQVEPDVWKIEGLDRRDDCARIVAAVRQGGRDQVSCIVLGRGEDDRKVREWLTVAAGVPGFIGFAVGRTDFWQPLVDWCAKTSTRDAAVAEIARRYREFVDIFAQSRT